ncbi:MAG: ATP-binding protein, partial [Myxococcota bacterium]
MANQVTIGPASYQVLLVEDSPGDAALVRHSLEVLEDESPGSFNLIHVERLDDALAELLARTFDLVVLDLSLPDSFGIESFARMSEAAKGVPVVVLTDVEDEELGSRLVQMGAQDHVVKWQIAGRVLVRCLRCAIDSRGIERELKRAREMALQAARSKIEFRTAMSHEIRTPLDSILGMADLLSETNLSAEQGRFVESFRVAGEALLDLVNGILDHSKIEAGRLDLDEIEFDVAQLLETTMETLAVPAHKKRLALAYEIDPSLDTSVFGDPARLRQVLVNLVGNAIKFTERGEILVSVTPEPGADAGTLRFCSRDTGVGIPKDELSKVFEAHPQSDGTIARRYGETGVGLR